LMLASAVAQEIDDMWGSKVEDMEAYYVALAAGTEPLTAADILTWVDENIIDQMVVSSVTGGSASIPPEIWKIINLGGDTTGSPIENLLSLTMDDLTGANSAGSWTTLMDDTLAWWSNDSNYGNNALYSEFVTIAQVLVNARDEDVRLGVAFDILSKYGERISTYAETAVDGLVTEEDSDPSALEILIGELSETSAGKNVLQNLTPHQLTLKGASLERQAGNPEHGYISYSELLSTSDIEAIKILMGVEKLGGDEGRNIKASVLGIPSTLFSSVYSSALTYSGPEGTTMSSESSVESSSSPLYGVKVTARIPDYPIFSVVPKLFRFDYELFVLPDAFDSVTFPTDGSVLSWEELVDQVTFTRRRFNTEEGSSGTSEEIVKIDLEEKEVYGDIQYDGSNETLRDIYSNTLASYLLEKYYKLMVGLGLSEDDFSTAGTGLEIPINDYAIDFAAALGSIYSDLESDLDSTKIEELFMSSEDIEGLSYSVLTPASAGTSSVATYSTMVNSFSTEIAAGEFTEVEASLFESFTNAASSRLFSAEAMRDKILGAKYFDRVVYILIDPDEFSIASAYAYTEEALAGRVTGPSAATMTAYHGYQTILLESGDFEVSSEDSSGNYLTLKITKRLDEGHLSFSSLYFTILREVEVDPAWGVTLNEDTAGDEMIDDSVIV